jgi:hypothetical protein
MDVLGLLATNAAEINAALIPCKEMALNSREYLDQRFAHVDATLARMEAMCAARLDLELAHNRLEAAVLACAAHVDDLQRRLGQQKSDAAVQCDLLSTSQPPASKRFKSCQVGQRF